MVVYFYFRKEKNKFKRKMWKTQKRLIFKEEFFLEIIQETLKI